MALLGSHDPIPWADIRACVPRTQRKRRAEHWACQCPGCDLTKKRLIVLDQPEAEPARARPKVSGWLNGSEPEPEPFPLTLDWPTPLTEADLEAMID